MGRTATNKAHKHFTYDARTNTSVCIICKKLITGKHGTNLKKHLLRYHNFKESEFKVGCSSTVKHSETRSKSTKISKKEDQLQIDEINVIKVKMTQRDLENSCIDLVTVNGRPFSILNDSGFLNIVNPIKQALEQTRKETFSITPESIKKKVAEEASNIRREISEEVKNNMVSIKIDAATHLDRLFLGINVQYIKSSKILLRTLGLAELKEKPTKVYLTTIIRNVCSRYNIYMDQIYTIITDSSANMLKAAKMLSSDYSEFDEANVNKRANVDVDLNLQLELDEPEKNEENEPEDHAENVLQIIENSIDSNFSNSILTGVRCIAHTLQLIVDDALKINEAEGILSVIKKARRLVKKLRTPTFLFMLKKQNLKKPIIDYPARCCSTIIMLERLLLLKDYCTELAVTKFEKFETLTDTEWETIQEVCQTLQPIKICIEKLQAEQLTLSDFFSNWLETKLMMRKINTPFAMLIFECMMSREKHLLNNDVLLSALFLDPRFKIVLEKAQAEKAKTHLKHLWAKMMSLQDLVTSNFDSQECPSSESESSSDAIESFLRLKEIHHNSDILQSSPSFVQLYGYLSLQRIEILLDNYYQDQSRIPRKTNILKFWQEKSMTQPELYNLAMIVLAVPATQVSVERLFSGLKLVLSSLRTNVEAILEDQLLVRANRIFVNKDDRELVEKRSLTMQVVEIKQEQEEEDDDFDKPRTSNDL
ncbi:uncharacterized protein LOC105205238 [Solenopsis invicta]|uniref:uncharacterized protein LOC105205238 n=1 Tax=Solenopsis invicta TaxID=13686 RepID=UPI000595BF15|nr:uncharacterized protein LOC105205238 [Solenopsis invicta]